MNKLAKEALPIKESDLVTFLQVAEAVRRNVTWSPKQSKQQPKQNISGTSTVFRESVKHINKKQSKAISAAIARFSQDELSETTHECILSLRTGVQIGFYVVSEYQKAVGIDPNVDTSKLSSSQHGDWNEKMRTSSAIMLFVMTAYIRWKLSQYRSDDVQKSTIGDIILPEFDLTIPQTALQCIVFYMTESIEKGANSDMAIVHMLIAFSEHVMSEIETRMSSLSHKDPFCNITYALENTQFTIQGFDLIDMTHDPVTINDTYPEDIIGNTESVEPSVEVLRKAFLYIPELRMNPIADFGGYQELQLLNGNPGNGKSMVLAMIMTLARDYAEASGLACQILVVPNLVSKMQGESTIWAQNYLRRLFDLNSVNIGIGDELEVFMPDHGDENVSEGDKKVAVEFLKALSGVSTKSLYNFIFFGATNYPENVDGAFMSRVKAKHFVGGAETIDDYVRFIVLNLRKLNKQYSGLINLKGVDWDMDTRAPQIANKESIIIDPTMSVAEIREEALKGYGQNHIYFFARFFYMMKLRQQMFSLRDCANIVGGAKAHVAGFSVPLEWITEHQHYIDQPVENKTGIIADMARQHVETSGVDFAQMLDQKAVYYAEESLRMAETRRMRAVEEMTEKRLVAHLSDKAFKEKLRLVV